MLDHTWKLKRQTGNAVSTSNIDILYEKESKLALEEKLLGAGVMRLVDVMAKVYTRDLYFRDLRKMRRDK